jgi:glycosyltransferase involved in cell wall biosynthesis
MHVLIAAVSSATAPTGICRHAANLARGLVQEDVASEITLAVGSWQAQYFQTAFLLDNRRIHLATCEVGRGAIERNLWYLNRLPTLAKLIAADVVHLSFPAPVLRFLMPCPVAATIHDLYPYDEPRNFAGSRVIFNRWFLRCCLHNSDALACVSEFTLKRLAALAPPLVIQKAERIYNCVAPAVDIPNAAPVSDLAHRPFLLAVAQHRANKNLDLLLRAFAQSREQRFLPPDCALVLVGSAGPQTRRLMKIIEQGSLAGDVFMLSAIPDAELAWLYRKAALLVVPSRIEGFCLPVVEALHQGCRVLCSDIPVLREIGGSGCQYFALNAPDPVEELAHGMAAAIERPRPTLGHPERFSVANMAYRYLELYSRIRRSALPGSMLLDPVQRVDRHAG